jgi:DNA polymerase-3 subunit beta
MKFTISKESFLDAINQVQHVVSSRTTLAILSNVLLKAKDGALELTTTDLDVGVTCSVPADVDEPGATTLPARRLATIVRELPAEEIESQGGRKKRRLHPQRPQLSSRFSASAARNFLALPRFDDAREFKIEQPSCVIAFARPAYSISTDETRYVLNGILFSFKDNALTMVATDGRRLAMVEQELEFPQSQEIDIHRPDQGCERAFPSAWSDKGDVAIRVTGSQVGFDLGRQPARQQADRRQLSELPPGHPRRGQGAHRPRTRDPPRSVSRVSFSPARSPTPSRCSSLPVRSRSSPPRRKSGKPVRRSPSITRALISPSHSILNS